ncbi:helix-turn-helix transcriptional regulator [Niallia taxi]|uniref:helix-turn-helix domain-containing protein n=1 Tax=Niallia taxi TaxID=2499688 RepID=UPI00317AD5CD
MALRKGRCRLPDILIHSEISQSDFAKRMKVAESTVSRWVNNKREMSYENAVLAAIILDCHAEDFYEWVEVGKGKRQR